MFLLLFIAIFKDYRFWKTTQPYYTDLSVVNAKIYTSCMLFKYQCVVFIQLYYNYYNTRQLLKSYATKISLNSEISPGLNIVVKSYMLLLCVYTKHDHAVHNFASNSNYTSQNTSKTVGNMDQTILLRYTNSIWNNFQCKYLTKQKLHHAISGQWSKF